MSKTAIFESDNTESPIQTIRQTMQVSLNDGGDAVVSFATNRGKGSGRQEMSVSDFREVVETLQHYADNGISEREEAHLSPADTIRQTIALEDGTLSFRTRSGKGAKPARIPLAQYEEVVELLCGTVDAVEAAGMSLSGAPSDESEDAPDLEDSEPSYEDEADLDDEEDDSDDE
jgi:hypothetical protein